MELLLNKEDISRFRLASRIAHYSATKACLDLTHTKRDKYPIMYKAILQETLSTLFPGSVPKTCTTNYFVIKLSCGIDLMVTAIADKYRYFKKNASFDRTGYLDFGDEYKQNESEKGKASFYFSLENFAPAFGVIEFSSSSIDSIVVYNSYNDLMSDEKQEEEKAFEQTEEVAVLDDFEYIAE